MDTSEYCTNSEYNWQNVLWESKSSSNDKKLFVNLPIGMHKYEDEYKNLMSSFDRQSELYINILYHIDRSYLEEMDEWNPDSDISMFNTWNMVDEKNTSKKFPLKNKRDVCYDFDKLMMRYFVCENNLIQKQNQINKKNAFIVFLMCIIYVLCIVLYNKTTSGLIMMNNNFNSDDYLQLTDEITESNTTFNNMLCLDA